MFGLFASFDRHKVDILTSMNGLWNGGILGRVEDVRFIDREVISASEWLNRRILCSYSARMIEIAGSGTHMFCIQEWTVEFISKMPPSKMPPSIFFRQCNTEEP